MTEAEITKQIRKLLDSAGVIHLKIRGSMYQKRGVADIVGMLPGGRFVAIEVKTAKGKMSPEQQAFIDAIEAKGGIGIIARCVMDVFVRINITEKG